MTAFSTADILLPRLGAEGMTKWATVACDQYTSQPEYWQEAERIAGDAPSALRLIFPEAFLGEPDPERRIDGINSAMERYLGEGVFECFPDCLILTRRTQADGRVRTGLVGAVDLEKYDYSKGSRSQVRATEATVPERIPPRVKIRQNASLELPHVMLLIDDPDDTVIGLLAELRDKLTKLYDFPLMQGGGRLEGWMVPRDTASGALLALDSLADRSRGLFGENALLFAVGDGNHSLATAKECYELKKRQGSPDAELQRYALVEAVNLHSPALEFEPIHRAVTKTDPDALMEFLTERLGLSEGAGEGQSFTVVRGGKETRCNIAKPCSNLTVGSLQRYLDEYLAERSGEIDYIHGEDVLRSVCAAENSIGFLLPAMAKEELFPTVVRDGALPRKTFSMGHAHDKRFYCEARRIKV